MKVALTWVDAVVLALAKHGGKTHLNRLYDNAPRIYGKRPGTVEPLIRDTLESRSSDSAKFDRKRKDLFTAPDGLRSGVWALRDLNWTIGDTITIQGHVMLLMQVTKMPPYNVSAHANPEMMELKGTKLIEFAQQLLPRLPLWEKAV